MYRAGTEPDPRFTLANERTLLAWIRTALAFAAGGVAVLLAEELFGEWAPAVSTASFGMALAVVAGALWRWAQMERALRLGQGLPAPWLAVAVVMALAVGSVVGAVAALAGAS